MQEDEKKIPLDQMMRKLKTSSGNKLTGMPEDRERVLRADGSEAIRVKSKRRRSIQPKKEKDNRGNKRKLILIVGTVVLLLLSVIAFSVLLGYFNGNRFKSKVSETVVNLSGAEVELGKLNVTPVASKLSNIDLKWSAEDTLLKSLKLKNLKADYGMLAFIGAGRGGSALGIAQADLFLEMGENNPRLKLSPERPVDFKFNLFQCSELNVDFGKGSLWSFKKGSVSYRVNAKNDGQFSLDSGDFNIPNFGGFKLQTGVVSFSKVSSQVYLDLKSEEQSGSINVDGSVGYTLGSLVDLKIELKEYPLKDWIDLRARRFINGKIHTGKGTLKMNLGDIDSMDINAKISLKRININDFEFVKTISQHLQEDYYVRPYFIDDSKMTIKSAQGKIEFTEIDFLQTDQLRITGNFMIDKSNQMSGSLKLGLPLSVLSRKGGEALKEVFIEDDGEYIWADITLRGNIAAPEDNLAEMIQEAAANKKPRVKQDQLLELKSKELPE